MEIYYLMYMRFWLFLLTFVLVVSSAFATHVAVLETMVDPSAKEKVSLSDRQYLTNVLREVAVKVLPAQKGYTIMTRENILEMLPPGMAIEDCEGECLVETGKNIDADYICQARIGVFGGVLTLSAELYETAGNKLMASFNGRGNSVDKLLTLIEDKAPAFFWSIKGKSTSFNDLGDVSEVGRTEKYSYSGKKKYVVNIESEPSGAHPTIDGMVFPKCTNTPCKVQVEEGAHRIVMTREQYDMADTIVNIRENDQRIKLELEPNFGTLVIVPQMRGAAADRGRLSIKVDGEYTSKTKLDLAPGVYGVRLEHPCYDPMEFKVPIERGKVKTIDKVMTRGEGGLELDAEYKGVPQVVPVEIDGVEVGKTPYEGTVPLCAEVILRGEGWFERVNVVPEWHDVVRETHRLAHNPDGNEQYNDAVENVGESIPTNVKDEKGIETRWIVLGSGAAASLIGVVLAVVGDNLAKNAAEKTYSTKAEYETYLDDAKTGQTLRGVGVALSLIGAAGIAVSFLF